MSIIISVSLIFSFSLRASDLFLPFQRRIVDSYELFRQFPVWIWHNYSLKMDLGPKVQNLIKSSLYLLHTSSSRCMETCETPSIQNPFEGSTIWGYGPGRDNIWKDTFHVYFLSKIPPFHVFSHICQFSLKHVLSCEESLYWTTNRLVRNSLPSHHTNRRARFHTKYLWGLGVSQER